MSSALKGTVFSRGAPSFDSRWGKLEKGGRAGVGREEDAPEGGREWTFPVGREQV